MNASSLRANRWLFVVTALAASAACGGDPAPAPVDPGCSPNARSCGTGNELPTEPGTAVRLSLSAADQSTLNGLLTQVSSQTGATAESLMRERPVSFEADLGYDPTTARNLDLIQASEFALNEVELAKLGSQGFAISRRHVFPNMAYGLRSIYAVDLPVYVSLDSILDAVHNSYDQILKALELNLLIPDLRTMLQSARSQNAASAADAEVRADLELYLSVALGLLESISDAPGAAPQLPSVMAGADPTQLRNLVEGAIAAKGIEPVVLFGVKRQLDFSQFTPRGHYTDLPELGAYFRAMIWLGRTDFRMIETKDDGKQVFHRRQFEAVLALHDAMQGSAADAHAEIDAVVSAFVGEHDYMQLSEIAALLADLNATTLEATRALPDQQIAQAIIDGGYGAQRIASQVIFKQPETFAETLPLDRSFALLGQRYVVDSHVFSDVVYDRVLPKDGHAARYLPDPLDAAYAALGNSAALPLLRAGLDSYGYAPQLERMRQLVDAHEPAFWDENLYNLWLSSLRAMSPKRAAESDELPTVAQTEAWSRRVLNTQLGSWAQLRHDTILYAKQSYTSGAVCEFPDAYVDPYPEAFARLAAFGARGKQLVAQLAPRSLELASGIATYFTELESVSNILRDMALQQQQGVPFNPAQMAFINDAVKSSVQGCGGPQLYTGWFARLLYNPTDEFMDPTIADVHTDPGGDRPPKVLHVATGLPRLMVVTANTCDGARAYAGLSFAYHEVVSADLKRLTDEEWSTMAMSAADVPWMQPVLR